jgi:hypothetical protein
MNTADMCARIVFPRYEHSQRHFSSVNGFEFIGNRFGRFVSKIEVINCFEAGNLRNLGANGLSGPLSLGLLSDAVGLLRSCYDFQGVIEFSHVVSGLTRSEHMN